MKVAYEDHDRVTIATLAGDFTFEHVDSFRRAVTDRLAKGARDFVLQVDGLNFIDSAGLESLLWLKDSAAEELGQVRLVAPSETVRKILEITRLAPQFESHPLTTDAIRSLR